MQRSLRNAKILQSKQKRVIKEQRQLIADLRKQQKKLAENCVSIDDVPGKQFILGQMRKCNLNKRARRYSGYDKNFALALHYCSPKCYLFLRKMFVLPTVRSLQRWLQNINVEPGFINPVLEMLKVKSANLPQAQKLCTLAFDEMSLKQLLTYNSQSDLFEGFVTELDNQNSAASSTSYEQNFTNLCAEDAFFQLENEMCKSPALANQAMVVLMRGIHSNFKQVIGYFLSVNAMSGELLKNIVLQSIGNVQDSGFIPKVIVTDQGSNNVLMRTLLGVTESKPYVEVNGEIIFFFYDAPHLLKSVRNNFKQHDVEFKQHICKWQDIVDFYNIDSKLTHRLAPKLSRKHIVLPPFSPMRVCLAAQTMSASVSKGILTCIALNVDGLESSGAYTADFIEFIDALFDVFNSSSVSDAKCLRRALSANSGHLKFLTEAKTALESMTFSSSRKRKPPCIYGWISNIIALQMLWSHLTDSYGCKFLLTRRLTQDCLENLFSVVRFKGGNNTTPDCSKFRHTLKSVLTNQLLRPSDFGNCDFDCSEFLLAKQEIESGRHVIFPRLPHNTQPVYLTGELCDSAVSANSSFYVTGWVCSRLEHRECRDALCSLQPTNEPHEVHISMKKYTENCKMLFPNRLAMTLAAACVNAFHVHFFTFLSASPQGVKQRLKSAVCALPDFPACESCVMQFKDKFFNVSIKAFLLRMKDREVKPKSHKQNKKFKKIAHL